MIHDDVSSVTTRCTVTRQCPPSAKIKFHSQNVRQIRTCRCSEAFCGTGRSLMGLQQTVIYDKRPGRQQTDRRTAGRLMPSQIRGRRVPNAFVDALRLQQLLNAAQFAPVTPRTSSAPSSSSSRVYVTLAQTLTTADGQKNECCVSRAQRRRRRRRQTA